MGNGASASGSSQTLNLGNLAGGVGGGGGGGDKVLEGGGGNHLQSTQHGKGSRLSEELVAKEHLRLTGLLKERNNEIVQYQHALKESRQILVEKEAEIEKLKAEIHKLKSVLTATVHKDGKEDILSTIHEEVAMKGQDGNRSKKQGVSGESSNSSAPPLKIEQHVKDFR